MTQRNQHGTAVIYHGCAVLLTGPPGCGKSSLAKRLIDSGATLVADDQVFLDRKDGCWFVSCPPALAGLLHLRDGGLHDIAHRQTATRLTHIFASSLPAFPLSRPPALGLPVVALDFHDPHAVSFITESLANIDNRAANA